MDDMLMVVETTFYQDAMHSLKGQGHVTINKPVISIIYFVVQMWPLCSVQISEVGVNLQ